MSSSVPTPRRQLTVSARRPPNRVTESAAPGASDRQVLRDRPRDSCTRKPTDGREVHGSHLVAQEPVAPVGFDDEVVHAGTETAAAAQRARHVA